MISLKQKTENVLVRFKPEVKEQFKAVADYKGLSMSGLITLIVKEEYRKMLLEQGGIQGGINEKIKY